VSRVLFPGASDDTVDLFTPTICSASQELPFIHHFDSNAQGFFRRARQSPFASSDISLCVPSKVQWQIRQRFDALRAAAPFSQTGEIAPAIDPRPNRQWA